MILKSISLQNFRSYKKNQFELDDVSTLIVGPNTSGKSNLIESIFMLSSGKSFRADKDDQLVKFGQDISRITGLAFNTLDNQEVKLEVLIAVGEQAGGRSVLKKYLVNNIPRRRGDFSGNLPAVLFSPEDLDIIIESPSLRRRFLDNVLEQTDREYRLSSIAYEKAIRQRNALLDIVKETGIRNERQFEYWDNLVIENGQRITEKRQQFIDHINASEKEIFDFAVIYDHSRISKERLEQYKNAEVAAGSTLVGPHRDDFYISMYDDESHSSHNIKYFGSRGQQRLAILQLKTIELIFMQKTLGRKPLLLLDDIFSELDEEHIDLILSFLGNQQTVITTAHRELVPHKYLKEMKVIEFGVK